MNLLYCILLAILIAINTNIIICANILGIFHIPSYSHFHLGRVLMKELSKQGHNVTMISSFPIDHENSTETIRNLVIPYNDVKDKYIDEIRTIGFDKIGKRKLFQMYYFNELGVKFTEETLKHPNVQQLLRSSNESFDLVIMEYFMNEAFKAMANHFHAKLIVFNTIGTNYLINWMVANAAPKSYVSEPVLGYSANLSFVERTYNLLYSIVYRLFIHMVILPKEQYMVDKYVPSPPKLHDIIHNVSLVLLNSHVSLTPAVPLVPNLIEIGGMHIQSSERSNSDVSPELKQYLDSATKSGGLIYFSLGSNVPSSNLSQRICQTFLQVFELLPLEILWKWETDTLLNQPKNVHISKWLPQQAILKHPSIKLFITHGGLLSITEAVHFGVPVLVVPLMRDQHFNGQNAVDSGMAEMLDTDNLDVDTLRTVINDLLTNPKYQRMAKQKSRVFHDRPMPPLDTAVYWVNYVLRHANLDHLRVVEALHLTWYQYYLLDVLLLSIGTVAVIFWMAYRLIKLLASKKMKRN